MRGFLYTLNFFTPKKKKIIFTSFSGRKFDDSPKALYDEICQNEFFDDYELVWLFIEPDKFDIPRGRKVKIDSFKYMKELLSARVWVSNSGIDRGLNLRFKKILNVNTWHGTPFKRMGEDIKTKECINLAAKRKLDKRSIYCAQSEHDKEIFKRLFNAAEECFLICDLPRNDQILKYNEEDKKRIRERIGLPKDKKIILYAPTFRDYAWDKNGENYIKPPIDLKKWEQALGGEYVLLFRAHYAITAALALQENEFVRDVSSYPTLNDLYVIADVLISDYSSVFFDYAILDRPMFCFAYDFAEYNEKRGVYENVLRDLPCEMDLDEDSLLRHIVETDMEQAAERTKKFRQIYAPNAGNATKSVNNAIIERLS